MAVGQRVASGERLGHIVAKGYKGDEAWFGSRDSGTILLQLKQDGDPIVSFERIALAKKDSP